MEVQSAAPNRGVYLQRPDLGRRLSDAARQELPRHAAAGYDAALVVADGLSALAVHNHAAPLAQLVAATLEAMVRAAPRPQ